MKRKILGMLVIIIFIFGFFAVSAGAKTSKTQAEALAWVQSKNGQKVGSGQCVALITAYYSYLGYTSPGGDARDYATNTLPAGSGWTREKGGVPKPGDILIYTGGYGHVAIHESSNISWHQNWVGLYVEKVSRNYSSSFYSKSEGVTKTYWGCIHIDFAGADTTAPTITKVWYSDVTETSFKVHTTATDDVGLVQIGCIAWSAKDGRDDQEWKVTSCSGKSATTSETYSISNHSNIVGTYYVSAHAYDTSWKETKTVMSYGPYINKYLDLGSSFYATIKNTKVGKVLARSASGDAVSQTYTGADNQIWQFTKLSDSTYKIINKASGTSLDVTDASTEPGAKVIVRTYHGGNNQRWYIQGSQNSYRLRAKSGWTVLDLYGLNSSEGAIYDLYGSNDSDAQLFTITKLSAATPTITAANVTGGKNVTITTTTSGATIYYTTDGSMPTTSSAKYNGTPFVLRDSRTVKAIAVASGYTNSAAASSTITVSQAAAPTITASDSAVTLKSSTSGATIYYTTNGSNPTTSSTKYTAPFNVSSGTTVKAIAVASGYASSSVTSKTITVAQASDYVFTVTQTSSAATVTNTSDKEQKAAVIITEYENGALKDVSSTNETFAAGEKKTYNFTGSGTHKVFVWNSLDGMVPLAK